MSGQPRPGELDYVRAAREAFEAKNDSLAIEQLAAALTFDPGAPDLLAMVDVVIARNRDPDALFKREKATFFGDAALVARLRARQGKPSEALAQLFAVVALRPQIAYLPWATSWLRGARALRGVPADTLLASASNVVEAADGAGWSTPGVRQNGEALAEILERMSDARPRVPRLRVLLSMVLQRLGRGEDALARLAPLARAGDIDALGQCAALERALGRPAVAADVLGRLLEQQPENEAAALDRIVACLDAGDWETSAHELTAREWPTRAAEARQLEDAVSALLRPARTVLARSPTVGSEAHLLWLFQRRFRTDLPVLNDPVAAALRNALAHVAASPGQARIRVRLRCEQRPSSLAALALAIGLRETATTGTLVWEDEEILPHTLPAVFAAAVDVDEWAAPLGEPGLGPEPADAVSAAFAHATLALADPARAIADDCSDIAHPAVAQLLAIASGADAWHACCAIAILGAVGRRARGLADGIGARLASLEGDTPQWPVACGALLSFGCHEPTSRERLLRGLRQDGFWRAATAATDG